MMRLALVLALFGSAALAQEEAVCPPVPDHADEIAGLLQDLSIAPDESIARGLNNALWELWTDAPDEPAQSLLDDGMARREAYDFLGAIDHFDRLVAYCPHYAEGYNQRAFVNFLRQEYQAALEDLEKALDLNPTHVGALSGKALTLMGLGQIDEGQSALREALKLNPWLRERGLLIEQNPIEL